jgi:predicted nucleic acid-binding protein
MASKIILDTNILLDLTLQRSQDYTDLRKIYTGIINGNFKGYTTTAIIQTSAYWLTKHRGPAQAKAIILALLNNITVIEATHSVVVDAMQSNMEDTEDALQYYTAMHHKLDAFISRDRAFINASTPKLAVYHPADFIRIYF